MNKLLDVSEDHLNLMRVQGHEVRGMFLYEMQNNKDKNVSFVRVKHTSHALGTKCYRIKKKGNDDGKSSRTVHV